jgi:hypothetical protein
MSGCRVVLCGCADQLLAAVLRDLDELVVELRMSPFLSASETMLVMFMMSVRTFSSVSTSSSRARTCGQRGLGVGGRLLLLLGARCGGARLFSARACSAAWRLVSACCSSAPASRRAIQELGGAGSWVLGLCVRVWRP